MTEYVITFQFPHRGSSGPEFIHVIGPRQHVCCYEHEVWKAFVSKPAWEPWRVGERRAAMRGWRTLEGALHSKAYRTHAAEGVGMLEVCLVDDTHEDGARLYPVHHTGVSPDVHTPTSASSAPSLESKG